MWLGFFMFQNECGLYRDDDLMIQEYINGQQIDQLRKKIIKIFKEIVFKAVIETNLKTFDFLDVIFNLINGSYKPHQSNSSHKPYKKPNGILIKIQTVHHR